ncbi:MAG: hypothetical protein MJ170_01685 [Alphaproteobacteria bacterium]|nr:hypothetical protein [Alphaproteobacteria bacterium]
MKRLFVVVGSLLVLPAFAEVAPQIIYADGVEYIDDAFAVNDAPVMAPEQIQQPEINQDVQNEQNVAPKQDTSSVRARARSAVPSRTASSRLTATRSGNANTSLRSGVNRRSVATRGSVTGNTNTSPRTVARASVVAPNVVSGTNVQTLSEPTSNTKTSVLGGGTTLYNGNSRVAVSGARVSSRNSGLSFSASNSTATSAQPTTEDMDKLAEVTDYYKAQYALCMDNYCNVLDDNQGRCSCSANLSNYSKTEEALTEATEALQEIAQQIQYIGLSTEDVETLFKQTDAELALSNPDNKDNSNIQSSLDKIKRMIVEVKTGKAASSSAATTAGISMDLSGLLDFSFDNTGFDLSSLLTTTRTTANTNSISNQRGANLYKTAAARCKASVLNSAAAQGVDISVISNSYDLEIDKACFAYERALTDANANMNATVRNAKSVLQKARLMVAQNKNVYDLRGCVEALDSCMQSDFICGTDYEGCLDPTGQYIVDGEVVIGSQPGRLELDNAKGLYATTWGDTSTGNNPWKCTATATDGCKDATLQNFITKSVPSTGTYPEATDNNIAKYLRYRIGYHHNDESRNYGMCISVLNQCQNYTYEKGTEDFKVDNRVVSEYLTRTLPRIKTAQDELLAEYAESCISDVETCLSNNGYNTTASTFDFSKYNAVKTAYENALKKIATDKIVGNTALGDALAEAETAAAAAGYSANFRQVVKNLAIRLAAQEKTKDEAIATLDNYLDAEKMTVSNDGSTTTNTIAMNACKMVITTCRSVNSNPTDEFTEASWVQSVMNGLAGTKTE